MDISGVRIYNGTAHDVVVYGKRGVTYKPEIRKYVAEEGVEILATIPKHRMLSAEIAEEEIGLIGGVIPEIQKKVKNIDSLPEGFDYYIVSAQYANAVQIMGGDISKLRTVKNTVCNKDGKVIGCLGIGPAL